MCGITGVFNYKSQRTVSRDILKIMTASLKHRGPDEEGYFIDQQTGVGLGHRRLSIIDLKTGKQPMSNTEEDIWIVLNGEIYNFPELKKELKSKGYNFRTKSDTEIVIYLYEEHGEEAFARLNGIFAFAIYDKRQKCVILARDHFGVKPLYYTLSNGRLLFGSEIKAILKDPSVKKELDYEAFNSFLTFRYNPSPQTLFKRIKKLLPGHYLRVTSIGNIELSSYWNYSPETNWQITEKEAIDEYKQLLQNAVQRQMISDVPLGLLLSGGVDSAIIGYLMKKFTQERVRTFTVGFPGKGDYNELDDARKTAKAIDSDHHELLITQDDFLNLFYKSFLITEEPISEPTIPALYYVSKLASKFLKVVLAGQGADEPLAGYHRYLGVYYFDRYSGIFNKLPYKKIITLLPRNERLKRFAYMSKFTTELQRFLAAYTIFTPFQKELLLKEDIKRNISNVDNKLVENIYIQTNKLEDSLSKVLFIDTRMNLSDNLLLFNDKITMANSLEMRVPFLDVDLIKFLESLPSKFKIKNFNRKYIHKKALESWLPKEIIYRKKRGFSTPIDKWLQTNLAKMVIKLLNANNSACKRYFNIDFINTMIDQHQRRKENFQKQIFLLLSFELWFKSFFMRKN